jgi:hypothetical protein
MPNSSFYELNPLPGAYGGRKSDIPRVCGGCGLNPRRGGLEQLEDLTDKAFQTHLKNDFELYWNYVYLSVVILYSYLSERKPLYGIAWGGRKV